MILITIFEIIAARPPVVMPDEKMFLTPAEATVPNIRRVAPPSTGSGIKKNMTPIYREESQQHEEQVDEITDIAACNTCQLDHTVILREYGIREGVEHTGQKRIHAVSKNSALCTL